MVISPGTPSTGLGAAVGIAVQFNVTYDWTIFY